MPFQNEYGNKPPLNAVAVTPSDSVDLAFSTQAIYIGGAGAVKVTMHNGGDVTLTALAVGVMHRIAARRIWSTGTTATAIVALG